MFFTFCTNMFWTLSSTQPGSSPDSKTLAFSFAGDRQRICAKEVENINKAESATTSGTYGR